MGMFEYKDCKVLFRDSNEKFFSFFYFEFVNERLFLNSVYNVIKYL